VRQKLIPIVRQMIESTPQPELAISLLQILNYLRERRESEEFYAARPKGSRLAEAVEFAIATCWMAKTICLFRLTVPILWHELAACLSRRYRVRTSKLRSSKLPVTAWSQRSIELESTAGNVIPIWEFRLYCGTSSTMRGLICYPALEGGSFIALVGSPNRQPNETGSL